MNLTQLSNGANFTLDNAFNLTVLEEVYPYNETSGRQLLRVRDSSTYLSYTLKIYNLKLNSLDEIKRELIALNRADFGNLVPKCRTFSVQNDYACLLLDWIDGIDLKKKFRGAPRDLYEFRQRVQVLKDICFAVEEVHNKKIVHRDLKPENILLSKSPQGKGNVSLIDFGLSVAKRKKLGEGGEGSYCRAPEQDDNRDFNLSSKADIFSVGMIGWWMLTGEMPDLDPDEDTYDDWENLHDFRIDSDFLVSGDEVTSILHKAMKFQPDKRYRRIKEFGFDLKNLKLKEGARA